MEIINLKCKICDNKSIINESNEENIEKKFKADSSEWELISYSNIVKNDLNIFAAISTVFS